MHVSYAMPIHKDFFVEKSGKNVLQCDMGI